MAPLKVIDIPKTEPAAYRPDRLAGKLLLAQTAHLHEALIRHLHELSSVLAIDIRSIKTESDASAYAQRATAILHPHAAKRAKQ